MHMMKLLVLVCIWAALWVAVAGRELTNKPGAGDVLCELTGMAGSVSPPGVYAVDPAEEEPVARLVVPYGCRPVWAPGRKCFAFWYAGNLWVGDIATGKFDYASMQYGADRPDALRILWEPGGGLVYYLSCQPYPSLQPFVGTLGRDAADALWPRRGVEQVGALSFSSDGKWAAYEAESAIAGVVEAPEHIRVGQVGAADFVEISGKQLEGALCYGPSWQPGGDLVAFNAFYTDRKRGEAFLWNKATGDLRQVRIEGRKGVEGRPMHQEGGATRSLGWSPSGDELLLLVEEAGGDVTLRGPSLLYAVPVDETKPIRVMYRPVGVVQAAAWSPDGDRVAVIRSRVLDPAASPAIAFALWRPKEGATQGVRCPQWLAPVWLSW